MENEIGLNWYYLAPGTSFLDLGEFGFLKSAAGNQHGVAVSIVKLNAVETEKIRNLLGKKD